MYLVVRAARPGAQPFAPMQPRPAHLCLALACNPFPRGMSPALRCAAGPAPCSVVHDAPALHASNIWQGRRGNTTHSRGAHNCTHELVRVAYCPGGVAP